MDTVAAQQRLKEMLDNLDRSIAVLTGEQPAGDPDRQAGFDRHPADGGTSLADADRAKAVLAAAQAQRAEVLAAMARVDQGAYGQCVDCSRPVPQGRLEARPEAARCVACQSKRDKRR